MENVDNYAMLPPQALGFALDSKSWEPFLIDGIQPDTASYRQSVASHHADLVIKAPLTLVRQTAETLAKACGKILLSVGIGDLGTTAETVEQSLNKLFEVVTACHGHLLM